MLKIKGLRKSFGSVIAADDIDLSVAPGEALGIIGPNGAGKTTLFNLIAGGLAPDAGEIRLNGRNITAVRPPESDAPIRSLGRSRISRYSRICWWPPCTAGGWRSAPPPRLARKFSSACI